MKVWIYECSAGFTSYTAPLCAALSQKKEHEVCLITVENNNELPKDITAKQILRNFDKMKKNNLCWVVNRIWISLVNILRRDRLVRKNRPDVLSIQFTIPIIDQYFLPRLKKYCKVVLTAHDVIPPNRSRFWSMKALNRIYHSVEKIIVHSEMNKRQMMQVFGINEDKIEVIHHGVAMEYPKLDRAMCRHEIGVDDDTPVILFYGSIREQKGLDDLICALCGVSCRLVIAGAMPNGESFTPYQELIERKGINSCTMINYVSAEQTNVLFQAADIVALPYKYFYSQSGVLMQAIQYSKYILATDVSAFGEYIHKWNLGCLCRPEDVGGIRSAALELCQWVRQKKNNEGAEAARKANSWKRAAELHWKVFEKELKLEDGG